MSPTFSALRHPGYRLWAQGAIVSNAGTWMQRVAQDWLVLTQLTDNSGLALGITTGLQFLPMLLLAPIGGVVADRFDRRLVLISTQCAMAVLALVLGLLTITGVAQLWHVYVLAGLLGTAAALDTPTRHAFVSELVPREDLPNAVGLNSASFHSGRLVGPALAGLLIHWLGTGPVFLINAVTFGAVLASLLRISPQQRVFGRATPAAEGRSSTRSSGGIRAGLRYVRGRPDIVLVLVVVGVVGMFGLNFQLTNALMARLEFAKGAGEYGLLGSAMAIGSLSGALLAARRARPNLALVLGASAAFGVSAIAAALMPGYTSYAISLIFVGLCSLTLMTSANAMVQLSTTPAMRGRVMSLYLAVFMGGTPLGAPVIGWIGSHFGARWSVLVGGVVAILTAGAALAWALRSPAIRLFADPVALGETPMEPTGPNSAGLNSGLNTDESLRSAERL